MILKEYNLLVALWGLCLLENRAHYLLLLVACLDVDLVGVSDGGISSTRRNGWIFLFKYLRSWQSTCDRIENAWIFIISALKPIRTFCNVLACRNLVITSWVRSFIYCKFHIYFSEKDYSWNWMVLATQLATLPYTFWSSHNLGAFISIKELNNLLMNLSSVMSYCLPMSMLNTKFLILHISLILLKYTYLGLGVMSAMSFLVNTLN